MILITGATGNVGSELVKQLSDSGQALRVVTRDESKVAHLDSHIERVLGAISDEAVAERAVKGVDAVFLFPLIYEEDHRSNSMLLKKAKEAGVKHIVMLSSLGAQSGGSKLGVLHREKEELVENSGIPWTFVRPGMFMTNTLQWNPTIQGQGKVFTPTGNGKVAPISQKDIARVAAVALTSAGHEGKIYNLTGPELLSAHQQVEILAHAIGKSIECVDVPVSAAAEQLSKIGAPGFLVESLSTMWGEIKEGKVALQTGDLELVTGGKGEKFEHWCSAHRNDFLN